jgi:hypothetical protein
MPTRDRSGLLVLCRDRGRTRGQAWRATSGRLANLEITMTADQEEIETRGSSQFIRRRR